MRALTLDEKITLKGLIARKVMFRYMCYPRLTTEQAIMLIYALYGVSIRDYGKLLR